MKIYLIPGLGADKRMYAHQLGIFADAEVLEHLPPHRNETLTDYSKRFIDLIDTSSPFALVGTSLGGMIAVELSRFLKPDKVILIASVKSREEMPLFIRSMKYLKLHRLFSGATFKRFNKLAAKRLDSRGDSESAEMILQMIKDTPAEFIEWAINAVIQWHPPVTQRDDIIHLHGTNDLLFPFSRIKNPVVIENGSHVMNMTMSKEVNSVLKNSLL